MKPSRKHKFWLNHKLSAINFLMLPNLKPTREMPWRFVFEHRLAYNLILVPSSLRTTLFVLVPRDETRRWAISVAMEDRKFREEASSKRILPPIVGRIERTRSRFTIGTTTFTCGFSQKSERSLEIRSRGTEPEIHRIFCPASTSPRKGVSKRRPRIPRNILSIGRSLPRRPRGHGVNY